MATVISGWLAELPRRVRTITQSDLSGNTLVNIVAIIFSTTTTTTTDDHACVAAIPNRSAGMSCFAMYEARQHSQHESAA
jgi:hypothetical protein